MLDRPVCFLYSYLYISVTRCCLKHHFFLLMQRLSNLRISANFNDHLCMKVSEACARVGVLDYGIVRSQRSFLFVTLTNDGSYVPFQPFVRL
jgi:hypothetical protein